MPASPKLAKVVFYRPQAGYDDTRPDLGIQFNPAGALIETFVWFTGGSSSSISGPGGPSGVWLEPIRPADDVDSFQVGDVHFVQRAIRAPLAAVEHAVKTA